MLALSLLAYSVSCFSASDFVWVHKDQVYTVTGVMCNCPINDSALKERRGMGRLTFSHDSCQFAVKKLKGLLQSQYQLYKTVVNLYFFFSSLGLDLLYIMYRMYLTNYTSEAVWIVVTSMRVKPKSESKSKVVLNSDISQILVKETAECLMTGKKKKNSVCFIKITIV